MSPDSQFQIDITEGFCRFFARRYYFCGVWWIGGCSFYVPGIFYHHDISCERYLGCWSKKGEALYFFINLFVFVRTRDDASCQTAASSSERQQRQAAGRSTALGAWRVCCVHACLCVYFTSSQNNIPVPPIFFMYYCYRALCSRTLVLDLPAYSYVYRLNRATRARRRACMKATITAGNGGKIYQYLVPGKIYTYVRIIYTGGTIQKGETQIS